jgi:hypothetical protein
MHLRRFSLVTLAAPLLFAACSSDSSGGNGASVPPFGGAPQQPTDVVETPGTPPGESPDTVTPVPPGVDDGSGSNEGQDPDTQLEQPTDTPVDPGAGSEEPTEGEPGEGGGPTIPAPVENRGADCVVPTLPAGNTLPITPNLPDPFTRLDGTRITRKSDWTCRRQEILQQVSQYIYGQKPPKPDSVTGTVTSTQITVDIQHNGQNESFTASVDLPDGEGPFPAVISFGGSGAAQQMSGMGVAVINFNQGSVGSRNTGIFGRLYGNNSAGDLAAWAWGASRIVDVIQAADSSIIDFSRLAVTGCSFLGKAAFATGALDERFALVVPLESGIGGVPSYKIVPELEPNPTGAGDGPEQPQHAINSGWLPGNSLVNDFGRLPVDTHEIIGLVAPRGLLVLGNTGGGGQFYKNLDFRSEYATAVAGKEIYSALGVAANMSYDSRSVNHCQNTERFAPAIQASVDRFLLGRENTTGEFTTDFEGVRTAPDQWVDWTTPTLEGELP